jgi:hypothetical protein
MIYSWVNKVIRQNMRNRVEEIYAFIDQPVHVQEQLLRDLLAKGVETEYGHKYRFDLIHSAKEFSTRVPLSNYAALKPYIERMRSGEKNILWPGKVQWYAKSSGTTSGVSKYIPVSKESIEDCHFSGGRFELALYCNVVPETKIFEGLGLRLGGSTEIQSEGKSHSGDLSAILIQNIPLWAELRSAPSSDTALMSDWEKKIDAIIDEAIEQNITSLWGVSSWFLVLFKKVLERTGKNHLLEVWPNLELFAHGGVNFAPYEEQFRALMPGNQVTFMENYNASEGFFAVQDDPTQDGMLLLLNNGIYYEFIPMDSYEGTNSLTIGLSEVELNKDYAVVITTNGGLWRYLLGDTVKFTSITPHRIKVSGRTAHFINAFGEEVIVTDAENAIQSACLKNHCDLVEFHAAPCYMNSEKTGGHQWIVEFKTPPEDLQAFVKDLDHALQEENSDYAAKRKGDLVLQLPNVVVAKPGLFHQWLKSKNKLGGQNKVPRLSNNRDLITQLESMNGANQIPA